MSYCTWNTLMIIHCIHARNISILYVKQMAVSKKLWDLPNLICLFSWPLGTSASHLWVSSMQISDFKEFTRLLWENAVHKKEQITSPPPLSSSSFSAYFLPGIVLPAMIHLILSAILLDRHYFYFQCSICKFSSSLEIISQFKRKQREKLEKLGLWWFCGNTSLSCPPMNLL